MHFLIISTLLLASSDKLRKNEFQITINRTHMRLYLDVVWLNESVNFY